MEVARPDYLPDPSRDRESMADQQRSIARDAVFEDDGVGLLSVTVREPIDLSESDGAEPDTGPSPSTDAPIVVGIDQAFTDEEAVSVAVAVRDGAVVEQSVGRAALEIPYIPGLLAYREAGAIVDALRGLEVDPDLLLLDGSGRIHYRQAGIAVHVGVLFDVPAIGVAKSLLCGRLERTIDDPLPAGTRVPIRADEAVNAPEGTLLGNAYQSRQFPNPSRRHVNPLFVSPGHRVSAATAVDAVAGLCAGYKLPEPVRLADRAVTVYNS